MAAATSVAPAPHAGSFMEIQSSLQLLLQVVFLDGTFCHCPAHGVWCEELAGVFVPEFQVHVQLTEEITVRILFHAHHDMGEEQREDVQLFLGILRHDTHVHSLSLVEVPLVHGICNGARDHHHHVLPDLISGVASAQLVVQLLQLPLTFGVSDVCRHYLVTSAKLILPSGIPCS